MFKRKSDAFTLIELIATLVIMAIIALVVTPLVMNIIRKARISADRRSVDAYGRSIELAIAGYLLDTGKFPTEVSQLTIEYSGNKVECETTQINTDSTVYLADCTVSGRSIGDYTYGNAEEIVYDYRVGDLVTYNGVNYRVLKDVKQADTRATLLKAEPLTPAEVNQFGAGHVNRYTYDSVGTVYNLNGYGAMAYYTSETCGYVNNTLVFDGCKNDYASSEVKYVVDAWKITQAPAATEARLISKNEYQEYCVEEEYQSTPSDTSTRYVSQYDWLSNSNYWYWTDTPYTDSSSDVWEVSGGILSKYSVHYSYGGVVRPVIVLPKSALSA